MYLASYAKRINELKEVLAKEKAAAEIRKLEQEIEMERSKYRTPISVTLPYSNHLTDSLPPFTLPITTFWGV